MGYNKSLACFHHIVIQSHFNNVTEEYISLELYKHKKCFISLLLAVAVIFSRVISAVGRILNCSLFRNINFNFIVKQPY